MKSHTKAFLFTTLDIWRSKIWKIKKIHSVNPLYIIFRKVNEYFEETNKSNYLTLVPTSESKEKIKKCEEL